MLLSTQLITHALAAHAAAGTIFVAYSGGIDSHVLLHLCASIPTLKAKITAVYVHHGLQAEADAWAVHCQQQALRLELRFKQLRVDASPKSGQSPEEAARNARYAALQSLMQPNDVVLIAQHQADQLETVLLQLFRGSGLAGLSGIPPSKKLGYGFLLRPLLDVPKQALEAYAKSHGLHWVEDPSNQSSEYRRNFLRNDIIPLLKSQWPSLDKTVARSASHCAQAQQVITDIAQQQLASVFNPDDETLTISELIRYSSQQQKLIIRQWLQHLGLTMPSHSLLEQIQTTLLNANADRDPLIKGSSYVLRRYRNKLYCLGQVINEQAVTGIWSPTQTTFCYSCQYHLMCVPTSVGIVSDVWHHAKVEVRFRQGGEKIRLPKRSGHHALKKLYQEAGIPVWERDLQPLVYLDDQLAAVGERWISAEFYQERQNACVALRIQSNKPRMEINKVTKQKS
ncbi:MAG: tRNA lysidine(34) synthetase TilS [Methylococcaceae bacterium]